MGRYLGLIIFILFVVWQVVTAIISQINANKQQQRAEELAKRRRDAGGATIAEGDRSGGGTSRIDDLAARRKAQLEELRRRREAGKSAPTTAQARTGSTATGSANDTRVLDPTIRRQPTIRVEPATRERKTDPWQARQDAIRKEREAQRERAARAEQERAAQQRKSQQRAIRERAESEQRAAVSKAERRARLTAIEPVAVPEPNLIRSRIHSPQELRELFVLKELLDPPVSLRTEQP